MKPLCRSPLIFIGTLLALTITTQVIAAPVLYGLGNPNGQIAGPHSVLYTIDTATGAATVVGDTGFNLRGLAIDPVTGKGYASLARRQSSAGGLYEIDLSNGASTLIGGTQNFSEMEFDASGNLIGYGSRAGATNNAYDFYSIDVSTGVGTLLNPNALSRNTHALFGITYSSADDIMYFYQQWTGSTGDGLSTVNITDGTVTPVVRGLVQRYRPDIAADDSGNLYAVDRAGVTSLYTLDKTTGNTTVIGSNAVAINSIAFTGSETVRVPLPSTLALFGLGTLGLISYRGRRRSLAIAT